MAEQELREEAPARQDLAAVKTQARFVVGSGSGVIPQNFEGLWRLASIMAASKMMPKGIDTPEAVFVAVQMGLEVGLSPMMAVQNIAVVNGRPSIWGDVGIALVQASGLLEDFKEEITGDGETLAARCWAKRLGRPTPVERTFTMQDAARAGLSGKGVWAQYPKRMLQMRARWWVLKDLFSDVLKGLRAAEEVVDLTPESSGQFSLPERINEAPADFASQVPPDLRIDVIRFLRWAAEMQKVPEVEIQASALRNMPAFLASVQRWSRDNNGPTEEKPDPSAPIIASFIDLKAKGFTAFVKSLTVDEFDSWPLSARMKFAWKVDRATAAGIAIQWPPVETPVPAPQKAQEEDLPQPATQPPTEEAIAPESEFGGFPKVNGKNGYTPDPEAVEVKRRIDAMKSVDPEMYAEACKATGIRPITLSGLDVVESKFGALLSDQERADV